MKVLEEGRRQTDVIELLPASMKVADMLADNPGNWLLECHVANHMAEGMCNWKVAASVLVTLACRISNDVRACRRPKNAASAGTFVPFGSTVNCTWKGK